MARNITLTLGAGLGADLGPNFNLTANVGSVTPSTATKSELTAGKSVSVDDLATEVTITSTGTCTNAITQTIPCVGGTTTTTTTSTTTAAPVCNEWYLYTNGNSGDGGCFDYFDCANTPQNVCIDEFNSATICAIGTPVQVSGTGCNSSNQGPCTTTSTTTETPTTTTTTTSGITYDVYYADEYDCATCTLQNTNVQIAFPTGTSVTVGKWYAPLDPNGYSYQLSSLTLQSGPGLIMMTSQFNNCAFACIV
jgi:hypothetical protein